MKGRSTTLEALSCLSDMKDDTIAINGVFIRETAQDAYGHLKEFGKIKAENSSLRTTVRQQKNRIANLEATLEDMTSRYNIADHNAKKKGERNAALQVMLNRTKCERNSAVDDLYRVKAGELSWCQICIHKLADACRSQCLGFTWRGPCDDNGGAS